MTCRHCQPLLSPYIDGALSSQGHHEVTTHLAQCAACTQHLNQLEQNRQLIRALPVIEVTEGMKAQLQSKVQSPKSKVQSPKPKVHNPYFIVTWWRNFPMLSYGTVATCAASLLFYFAMMQSPSQVSAEEVVSSMDQLIGTLDPDEGERAITEETPDEVMPDWFNETDRELFENENEQD